jgi:hypothetical protein
LTSREDRRKALQILDAAMATGARACKLAELLGVGLATPAALAASVRG